MEPIEVAHAYFDAWNRHDPDAIVACFADGGTYTDPGAGTLTGPAIGAYAGGLFAAFPDLSFDILSVAPTGDTTIAAEWLMKGTNAGSMRGLPPTGKTVSVPGADFIVVDGDKVRSVTGYFDGGAIPRQLGMQIIVQPHAAGPFRFGYSVLVHSGKTTRPGAFGLTVITARSPEDEETIRTYSRQIAPELLQNPGFISLLLANIGGRMFTISAYESPDDIKGMPQAPHRDAVKATYTDNGVGVGGSTSVWQPHHLNTLFLRCPTCQQINLLEGEPSQCACGAALPTDFPYW
jgi:steroid delta-isomerase-like uncharacterized protein